MSDKNDKYSIHVIPWKVFWSLWFQKNLRNIASIKYQWLVFIYLPVIWGMFNIPEGSTTEKPWISAAAGLGCLGGGFVTLALGRIYARTKLTEDEPTSLDTNNSLDTDK